VEALAPIPYRIDKAVDPLKDFFALEEEDPTFFGQSNTKVPALEKLEIQFGFELANVPTEGRLSDTKRFRRPAKTSRFGDSDKISKFP